MSYEHLRIALNSAITMSDLDIVVDPKATDCDNPIVASFFVFFPLSLVTQYSNIRTEMQTIVQNLKLGFPTADSITEELVCEK